MWARSLRKVVARGTNIGPHDGQQWSMMNLMDLLRLKRSGGKKKKKFVKMLGIDHAMASVNDWGANEIAHGNFFHKNSQVAISTKTG